MKLYKIGEVAKLASVRIETVRFYESLGLVKPESRTKAGYRQFSQLTLEKIRFTKKAQSLGFTLKEIGELLEIRIKSPKLCEDVKEKTITKLKMVEEKIKSLEDIKLSLEKLIKDCSGNPKIQKCPIIENLEN